MSIIIRPHGLRYVIILAGEVVLNCPNFAAALKYLEGLH